MSRDLRKRAAKRLAAVNSTPVSSHPNTDDEDGWSDDSSSTVDSYTSAGSRDDSDLALVQWEDDLKQSIDDLSERRAATREAALAKLVKLLSRRFTAEVLDNQRETVMEMLKRSIKKASSTKESTLATKAVSLTFITLGEDVSYTSSLYSDIIPLLKYTATTSAVADIKVACLEALALSTLIAGSDAETQDVLSYLSDILQSSGKSIGAPASAAGDHALVMTSALNAYGLLFAVVWGEGRGTTRKCWEQASKAMPSHLRLLSSASTDIRVAAGENIALFFESLDRHNASDEDASDHDDDGSDNNRFHIPKYDRLPELVDILTKLATDSNRHHNKKSRATQKSAFRDILRTVESNNNHDNHHPSEKLKFRRGTVTFQSWSKILILNAFRAALAEGLQTHFEENPLLHDIFHYFPLPAINLLSPGPVGMSRTSSNRSNRSNRSGYSTPRERDEAFELPKTEQKYLNAEMAKERKRDLKKARGSRSKVVEWED